eukprot:GFYU01002689.1.p1 GENE.GFYU01002689.1~~GFYU01002689.1.p1  ORF type:complete len:347 (-),score=58.51 GFYU01002689.1:51-1091(-)
MDNPEPTVNEVEIERNDGDDAQAKWWEAPDVISGPVTTASTRSSRDTSKDTDSQDRSQLRAARVRKFGSTTSNDQERTGSTDPVVAFGSFSMEEAIALTQGAVNSTMHEAQPTENVSPVVTQLTDICERIDSIHQHTLYQSHEIKGLNDFAHSIYTQVLAQHDYMHGSGFVSSMEEHLSSIVRTKVLPQVWKLERTVEKLEQGVQERMVSQHEAMKCSLDSVQSSLALLQEAFDQKIHHVEVIGNGAYKDGKAKRKLVSEKQLQNHFLGVRSDWKADSQVDTINKNFEQMMSMMNDVILTRIDQVEEKFEKRLGRIEKKVDVLHSLYNHSRQHQSHCDESDNTNVQ